MHATNLADDLVVAIVAAFIGGLLAQRVRQPAILGYLVAGLVIGPGGFSLVRDTGNISVIAEIGVAFLLFALGAEFAPSELRRFGPLSGVGGLAQILLTALAGALVGLGMGLDLATSLLLGALLSLSSTVVALKLLQDRGEASSLHGRLTTGFAIVQDLALVPMVILLPVLAGGSENATQELTLTVAKGAALLLTAYLVGTRIVPLLLERAASGRSRDLFLLGTVSLALGTSVAAEMLGLSFAFGAFLAGLVVAGSIYAHQVVAEVLPLRDLFASLFFVSIGMLANFGTLLGSLGDLVPLLFVATVVKIAIVAAVVRALGMPGPVALSTGLALGQVGEFSFVLARIGVERGAMEPRLFDLVLGTAIVSMSLTPLFLTIRPRLLGALARVPLFESFGSGPSPSDQDAEPPLRGHVVVCGYGRAGRELALVLRNRRIPLEVIEYNPRVVADLRHAGIRAIYGDAGNPTVLEHVHLEQARVLAIAIPDATVAERIVRFGRAANPRLDILARAESRADLERLRRAGASDVVLPGFEGGLEFIRHTMRRFGVLGTELQTLVAGRRVTFYSRAVDEPD